MLKEMSINIRCAFVSRFVCELSSNTTSSGQLCYWGVKFLTIRKNPAFGPQQIRELTEILEKAIEVNILLDETFIQIP